MQRVNSFSITMFWFLWIFYGTKQSHVRQTITTLKTIGNAIKNPFFKKIGNTIKKPVFKTFGNTIKNPMGMFRRNKNTIKNLAYGLQEKYLKSKHYPGNKSVKYLKKEAINFFKFTAPYTARGSKQLFKTEGKRNIQTRSVAYMSGKGLVPVLKRSAEQMRGKDVSSLINMVSKSKPQVPFLFAAGGLNNLTRFSLKKPESDIDPKMKGNDPELEIKVPKKKYKRPPSQVLMKRAKQRREDAKLKKINDKLRMEDLKLIQNYSKLAQKGSELDIENSKLKLKDSELKLKDCKLEGYSRELDYMREEWTEEDHSKLKEEYSQLKEKSSNLKQKDSELNEEFEKLLEQYPVKEKRAPSSKLTAAKRKSLNLDPEFRFGYHLPHLRNKNFHIDSETGEPVEDESRHRYNVKFSIQEPKMDFSSVTVETDKSKTPHIHIRMDGSLKARFDAYYVQHLIHRSYPKATYEYVEDRELSRHFIFTVDDKVVQSKYAPNAQDFKADLNDLMTRIKNGAEPVEKIPKVKIKRAKKIKPVLQTTLF